MGEDCSIEMDINVLPSMWPEDLKNEADKEFNIEQPGASQDMLEEVSISKEPTIMDYKGLKE